MSDSSTVGLGLLAVGAVSVIAAVLLFLRSRRFLGNAVSTQGLVTGMEEGTGSEGGTVYRPVVEFTSVDGQAVTFTDMVGSSPPRYTPGTTVKVMYPPGDPQAARIPSWFRMWFLPSFSALFAVIFLGVGGLIYLSGGDTEKEVALPPGISIPSIGITIPPGLLSPDVLPSLPPPGNPVLLVQQGSGVPQALPVTCESIRDVKGGKAREVRLSFQGGMLTFTASPYTGPGAYTPSSNLEVGGTVFRNSDQLTGAVVFDKSGQAGAVNLVAGSNLATGAWDCTDLKVS